VRALPLAAAGERRFVLVDPGLDDLLADAARALAGRAVSVRLRDPSGALRLDAAPPASGAPAPRDRIVALRGALAGFSAELGVGLPPAGDAAIASEVRALGLAFAAAALTILAGGLLVVRGAARALELERTRGAFVAGVTHDLKTPLALVRMYAETIRLGRVEERAERDRFLDVIIRETDRLHALIDNVLSFQRRGAALEPSSTDLGATLREVVAAFTPARDDPPRLELAIEAGLPPVRHDRGAVEQIVRNLLSNAVRYAPSASAVRVTACRDGAGVRVAVADEGPGVPPEVARRAFEPFAAAGPQGGTGLGLALVRDLAEAHGGRARLARNEPRGTVVEVWLAASPGSTSESSEIQTPGG
jgi:two-component system phosphate regulon sensor histidine kinase PhoR